LRVDNIVFGPAVKGNHIGLEASTFAALPTVRRLGPPWTADFAKTQTIVTRKGFWSNSDNRRGGLLTALVVGFSADAVSPASQKGDSAFADDLASESLPFLKTQRDTALQAGVSAEQADRLASAAWHRELLAKRLVDAVRAGLIERADALAMGTDLANLVSEYRTILSDEQMASWKRGMLASESMKDTGSDLLAQVGRDLPNEIRRLDLADAQQASATQLINSAHARAAALTRSRILGNVDEAGWNAQRGEIASQLLEGLKHILTPDQLAKLESQSKVLPRLKAAATQPAK
jgi:hypothetical protein